MKLNGNYLVLVAWERFTSGDDSNKATKNIENANLEKRQNDFSLTRNRHERKQH